MEDFWDMSDDLAECEAQVDRRAMEEKFLEYETLCGRLLKKVESLQNVNVRSVQRGNLWHLKYRLMQGPVRLLVLGASSAGKSTLVNALAGGVVSPEGEWTSTYIPAWVRGVDTLPAKLKSPVYHVLCYADPKEVYQTREQYMIHFCYPPGEKTTRPGFFAVRVETESGFLVESGITLLDTPGVAQSQADTRTALKTLELGAELLLLVIRDNTFKEEEEKIYSQLFPGGDLDLRLEPSEEVFCLYNARPLSGQVPENVADSFRSLASHGNDPTCQVDTEGRLYCVNVLEERRRWEEYRYLDWAPDGITQETASKLSDWQSLEENGDPKDPNILGHRQMAGSPASEEMQRLIGDLKLQAQAWYADPERLCAPIEQTLRNALQALLADCRLRIKETDRQIEEETAALTQEQLVSPELAVLREQLAELVQFADQASAKLEALKGNIAGFRKDLETAGNSLKMQTDDLGDQTVFTFDKGTNWGDVLESEQPNNVVEKLKEQYAMYAAQARIAISDGTLLGQVSGWMSWPQIRQRIKDLQQMYESFSHGIHRYAPSSGMDFHSLTDRQLDDLEQSVTVPMPPMTEIREHADSMARDLMEKIQTYQSNRPSQKGFLAGMRSGFQRVIHAGKLQIDIRIRLRRLLNQDLERVHSTAECRRQALEERLFEPMNRALSNLVSGLAQQRETLTQKRIAEEDQVRAKYKQDLKRQRLEPLEREEAELQKLIQTLPLSKDTSAKQQEELI